MSKTKVDVLSQLRESYPSEPGSLRIQLPRLSMASQDKTEGKGKTMKVVVEAGTFFTELQTDEVNDDGKKVKVWEKTELGTSIKGVILYQRKQLRLYNESTETYTSSPVYDADDEVVPLWSEKKEVARDTPANLKKLYKYVDKEGKEKSKLEDNRILYVLFKGEVYQLNLRGTSMYSFLTYARKTIPNTVVTKFSSEAKDKGTIRWNQMSFSVVEELEGDMAQEVLNHVSKIKSAILLEKSAYVNAKAIAEAKDAQTDKELKELTDGINLD